MDFPRRKNCPHRVILMRCRHSEEGHRRVTHKLFNEAAIGAYDCTHRPEYTAHQLIKLFRVKLLGKGGKAGKV